jgi:hypothetical protein
MSDYLFWGTVGLGAIFIICLIAAIPSALENERQFIANCTARGGIPSMYETVIGKTSQSERLCIKKENVVELR